MKSSLLCWSRMKLELLEPLLAHLQMRQNLMKGMMRFAAKPTLTVSLDSSVDRTTDTYVLRPQKGGSSQGALDDVSGHTFCFQHYLHIFNSSTIYLRPPPDMLA